MLQPPESRHCVLLVDDDDAVRRSLQFLLQSRGYAVRAYPSGVRLASDPAALACCCLLADLMMPQTDAVELLTELRAAGWNGRSILISGFLDDRREAFARAAGYEIVLPKPISQSVLMRTIEELMPRLR
ncbi:response regulator [Qipengyuania sp. SM2507]